MNKKDAITHFGTQAKFGAAIGRSQSTISGWGDSIPQLQQLLIQKLTRGKLKADVLSIPVRDKSALIERKSIIGSPISFAIETNPPVIKPMGLTA